MVDSSVETLIKGHSLIQQVVECKIDDRYERILNVSAQFYQPGVCIYTFYSFNGILHAIAKMKNTVN